MASGRLRIGHGSIQARTLSAEYGQYNLSGQVSVLTYFSSGIYSPTHYVAPFASVSGASNDYDDLGASSWSNATNPSTPTTLGTAHARAVAGNQIRCRLGVYSRLWRGRDSGPGWATANSGTVDNPIIFFCETPAATNRSSPELWSELRWSGSPPTITEAGYALLGSDPTGGGNHVYYDGFALRRQYALPYASAGVLTAGATNIQFRRFWYDYEGTTPSNDNYIVIWLAGSVDAGIYDSYFTGSAGSGNHNATCITGYGARNYSIQNNTFENVNSAFFAKGRQPDGSENYNYGVFSYNRLENVDHGLTIQHTHAGQYNVAHHNLLINAGIELDSSGTYTLDRRAYRIYSNTFVGGNSLSCSLFFDEVEGLGWEDVGEFYNNLLVDPDASVSAFLNSESGTAFATMFDVFDILDNNVYYDAGGAAQFHDTANRTFSQYRTAISGNVAAARESNSSESTVTLDIDYKLVSNGQAALTASDIGGPVGCYITDNEEIGIRENPVYP